MAWFDATLVRAQVLGLRNAHPDIWDEGDDQLIADTLEGQTDLHPFLAEAARIIFEAEGAAAGTKLMITSLKKRHARAELRAEKWRALVLGIMIEAGIRTPIVTPVATLSVARGVPKVMTPDESLLPEEYWRVTREPNKTKIALALSAGVDVPGATWSNAEPRLTMR